MPAAGPVIAGGIAFLILMLLASALAAGLAVLAVEATRALRRGRNPTRIDYYRNRCPWPLEPELEQRELAPLRKAGAL